MTAFAAVAMHARGAVPDLPQPCVAALDLAGAGVGTRHSCEGFAGAAAAFPAPLGGVVALPELVVAGHVRLDAKDTLRATLGLARDANAAGASAGTDDLALVAAAWREFGDGAVARLRGDFSLVVWDATRRLFLAARDGMGVRPLYFAAIPGGVVASNVLDAVRAHPAVSSRLDEAAVASFLRIGWNADLTTTSFAAIHRLAPGTAFVSSDDHPEPRVFRHWRIPDPALVKYGDAREYLDRYRALLAAAVRDRVEPGRTVLFLSGGIDSPTIAAASRAATGEPPLRAVTRVVGDVESGEEARLAASVAARLGLPHEVIEAPTDPRPEQAPPTPEPYDDAEYAAYRAFLRQLPPTANVILDGEDGDALFAPPGLGVMLRREGVAGALTRIAAYTLTHARHPYLGFWLRRRLRFRARRQADAAPRWLSTRGAAIRPAAEPAPPAHAARPEAAASLSSSLWQSIHDGVSRAFHGAPVEVRWPLLDERLLEFVFALPAVPWCQLKWLPRRAYRAELPREVIGRRKTTIPGYHARLVNGWRARTGAAVPPLHPVTAEFVDHTRLLDVLKTGGTEEVLAAWRAIEFDRWVTSARVA